MYALVPVTLLYYPRLNLSDHYLSTLRSYTSIQLSYPFFSPYLSLDCPTYSFMSCIAPFLHYYQSSLNIGCSSNITISVDASINSHLRIHCLHRDTHKRHQTRIRFIPTCIQLIITIYNDDISDTINPFLFNTTFT